MVSNQVISESTWYKTYETVNHQLQIRVVAAGELALAGLANVGQQIPGSEDFSRRATLLDRKLRRTIAVQPALLSVESLFLKSHQEHPRTRGEK